MIFLICTFLIEWPDGLVAPVIFIPTSVPIPVKAATWASVVTVVFVISIAAPVPTMVKSDKLTVLESEIKRATPPPVEIILDKPLEPVIVFPAGIVTVPVIVVSPGGNLIESYLLSASTRSRSYFVPVATAWYSGISSKYLGFE